ncbi:MAG: cyclopropane-fatty-acyl-phospholipid synthase family protein [Kofleriaceae bacterium]
MSGGAGAGLVERLVSSGRVPELALRAGIRAICALRLREQRGSAAEQEARLRRLVAELSASDIAIETEAANRQHYEVPAGFFALTLGPHLKYSGCYWPRGVAELGAAEEAMLELYAERAELAGSGVRRVLDLGCGWGSFSLWAAARLPHAEIWAVSNSHSQRRFLEEAALARGLRNLRVITADVRRLELPQRFDRVVSVEMFEHMRNYRALLAKVASWLAPGGKLFVHVFAHRRHAYAFESRGASDWMAREFFSGGLMPSTSLLHHFQDDVRLEDEWHLDGTHYARTAEAWHRNLRARWDEVVELFAQHEPAAQARQRAHRWRVFYLACAEMFGYRGGREWLVAHYRFTRRA